VKSSTEITLAAGAVSLLQQHRCGGRWRSACDKLPVVVEC